MLKHTSGTAYQVFETVRYSSYGVPFGITPGDIEGDGDCDGDDNMNWPGSYQVRCDYDLDGDMDVTDQNLTITNNGRTLGRMPAPGAPPWTPCGTIERSVAEEQHCQENSPPVSSNDSCSGWTGCHCLFPEGAGPPSCNMHGPTRRYENAPVQIGNCICLVSYVAAPVTCTNAGATCSFP